MRCCCPPADDPVPPASCYPPSDDYEVTFVAAGELTFEVLVAGDAAAPKGLALCLHGFPESAYSWRHQMPVLAALGFRVWAPSLRGYGRTSPRPHSVKAYKLDKLLADVAALIAVAGFERVTLIGHDWGGAVAWAYALRQLGPLHRLIVMNLPHPTIFYRTLTARTAEGKAQRKRSWYFNFFRYPVIPERALCMGRGQPVARAFRDEAPDAAAWPDEALDVLAAGLSDPSAVRSKVNWYRANPMPEAMAGPWPDRLDVPTLLIWGRHDKVLGLAMTEGTHELVTDFTLKVIDASHSVQQDAPAEVNAILREWLTRDDGGAGGAGTAPGCVVAHGGQVGI